MTPVTAASQRRIDLQERTKAEGKRAARAQRKQLQSLHKAAKRAAREVQRRQKDVERQRSRWQKVQAVEATAVERQQLKVARLTAELPDAGSRAATKLVKETAKIATAEQRAAEKTARARIKLSTEINRRRRARYAQRKITVSVQQAQQPRSYVAWRLARESGRKLAKPPPAGDVDALLDDLAQQDD